MIKFFNVYGGETKKCETPEMIAAFYNSSDMNPNGRVQDFGWRLAPATAIQVREMQDNEDLIEKIANKYQIPLDNVTVLDVLRHISALDDKKRRQEGADVRASYQKQYEEELAALEAGADSEVLERPAKSTAQRLAKQKVSSPAEIAKIEAENAKKLADMVAESEKSVDNKKTDK